MRTTVTLDADTEHLLRERVRKTGKSFKETLNDAIRRGISAKGGKPIRVTPLFTQPFPREFSKTSMNGLAEAWDDEETLLELVR